MDLCKPVRAEAQEQKHAIGVALFPPLRRTSPPLLRQFAHQMRLDNKVLKEGMPWRCPVAWGKPRREDVNVVKQLTTSPPRALLSLSRRIGSRTVPAHPVPGGRRPAPPPLLPFCGSAFYLRCDWICSVCSRLHTRFGQT